MLTMIKLAANNDTNGNPRRCYVLLGESVQLDVFDEGFAGINAVPEKVKVYAKMAPEFTTTPKEYKRLVKWGREYGVYHNEGL